MDRRRIEVAAFFLALIVAVFAIHAWLASRNEQLRLQSTLAAQKRIIDSADSREHARDADLNKTLAEIDNLKRTTQTPEQILRELPKYLPLPQAITLVKPITSTFESSGPSPSLATQSKAPPENPVSLPDTRVDAASAAIIPQSNGDTNPNGPRGCQTQMLALPATNLGDCVAQIPADDLKPIYDYVQDCRACQAQLLAARQNAADDATKISALTRERDAATNAAKGGTIWHRFSRNTLWFGIGAVSAYAALNAHYAHH